MYAEYFNHHQTANALLHRGADQHVETANDMKWETLVSNIQNILKIGSLI